MKLYIILLFNLFLSSLLFGQQNAIKITRQTSQKEIVIKENKRIKIKTIAGEKISGRFAIQNDSIILNNRTYALSDIAEIKRNPLLTSIVISGFLIYAGAITAGLGAIIGVFVDTTAFWLVLPAAGMIYTGIKSPNFNRKYKNDGSWTYELITITD